jgi:pyruvate-ferredoxin/flavodoxin oxidoreductase
VSSLRRSRRVEDGRRRPTDVNAEHETGTAFLESAARYVRRSILGPLQFSQSSGLEDGHPAQSCSWCAPTTTRWFQATAPAPAAAKRACCAAIAAVTEAYMRPCLPRQERPLPGQGRRTRKVRRCAPRSPEAERNPEEYKLLKQLTAHLILGLGGENTEDTKCAHQHLMKRRTAPSPMQQTCGSDRGDPAHRSFQSQEPAAGRWTPGQRHERDGDGGAHRLQHGLRLNRAQQSASLSVDELALPGRHHVGWLMGESFIVDHARRSVIAGAADRHSADPRRAR